jgi:two-component system, OmpR family, phosphate regulon sensor histidine kinase PhoR
MEKTDTTHAQAVRSLSRESSVVAHGVICVLFLLLLSQPAQPVSKAITALGFITVLGFGVLKFIKNEFIEKHALIYVGVLHIAVASVLGLATNVGSMYFFLWAMLVYIANFYFNRKGAFISLLLLALTLEVSVARAALNSTDLIDLSLKAVLQWLIILGITLFFIDTESVTARQKQDLTASADQVELERERLLSLVNSMSDAVIATDDKGQVKLFNAAAMGILDTNKNLIGMMLGDFMSVIDQARTTVDILGLVTSKKVVSTYTDYFLVYEGGEKINIFLGISPIKLGYSHETESGFIITFRDITREKSLEEERNEFISVVSHELRTPIAITEANISNAQFIVDQGKDPGAIKSALEAAHRQALYLANMINDLSTLSRAERGKLDSVTEDISPIEIMRGLYDDYNKEAHQKGLELISEIPDGLPEAITSNRLYVREILQNFVTNAIKYTRDGTVTISAVAKNKGVEFSVKDTGIGISKSDQKRVFDKFFRSEDFRTRENSGTGLGLYITQKLMKLIQAEISMKSQLNVGSTFIVYIPSLEKTDTKPSDK